MRNRIVPQASLRVNQGPSGFSVRLLKRPWAPSRVETVMCPVQLPDRVEITRGRAFHFQPGGGDLVVRSCSQLFSAILPHSNLPEPGLSKFA